MLYLLRFFFDEEGLVGVEHDYNLVVHFLDIDVLVDTDLVAELRHTVDGAVDYGRRSQVFNHLSQLTVLLQ